MAIINHQYEPPRLPSGWSGEERKFYTALIDVLDDIYLKWGRLSEKDLNKSLQGVLTEAKRIALLTKGEVINSENLLPGTQTWAEGATDPRISLGAVVNHCVTAHGVAGDTPLDIGNWTVNVEPDTDYALSFWARGSGSASTVVAGATIKGEAEISLLPGWQRITKVLHTDTSGTLSLTAVRCDGEVWVAGVKLEKGSESTYYEPMSGELFNNSLVLDENGIQLTGGELLLEASAMLRIASGGTVQIEASSAEDSYIDLGNGNFSASKTGGVNATRGSFSEALKLGGHDVVTAESLPVKVVISGEQPEGNGILWLQPSSNVSVTYAAKTPGSRNNDIRYGAHMPPNQPITLNFTSTSGDTITTAGQYTYTMSFELYSLSDVNNLGPMQFGVTLEKNGQSVDLTSDQQIYFTKYSTKPVTVTYTGSTNLVSDAGTITAKFTAINGSSYRPDSTAFSAIYLNSNQNINLEVKSQGASGAVQPCTPFYIP